MDYYSGSASSITDLRDALYSSLTTSGFTITSNVVTKSGTGIEALFTLTDTGAGNRRLVMTPRRSGVAGPTTFKIFDPNHVSAVALDWPCPWECYIFDEGDGSTEVYFIVKYAVDFFQSIAFGDSPAAGVSSCPWYSATFPGAVGESVSTSSSLASVYDNFGFRTTGGPSPWTHGALYNTMDSNWAYAVTGFGTSSTAFLGISWCAPYIAQTPSAFTSIPILVPIRTIVNRPTLYARSFALELRHSRAIRLDNNLPEDVLTYGSETWKLYPLLRRDGNNPNPIGTVQHTGTYGYAIRTS